MIVLDKSILVARARNFFVALLKSKTGTFKIGKYTLVGFLFDLVDWVGLGLIPVLMDVFDFFAAMFWMAVLKSPVGLVALVEVIPLADVLPTNIALGLYADSKRGGTWVG